MSRSAQTGLGSTVRSNSAAGNGGGISDALVSGLQIDDSTIARNSASSNGGGIFNAGGSLVRLSGGTSVERNTAANDGGGVYNGTENHGFGSVPGELMLNDSASVTRNTASDHGGESSTPKRKAP